jgi:hypothetical protein
VNSRYLGRLGLALIGVYALLITVSSLTTLVTIASTGARFSFAVAAVPMALVAVLSYVLVFHNDQVAAAILPDDDAAGAVDLSNLPQLLVVLLGVLILIQSIPETLNVAMAYFAATQLGGSARNGVSARFFGAAIQIAIALYLIARPQRLLDFAQRSVPQ